MEFETLDIARDRKAVHRIWHEVGWGDIKEESEMKNLDLRMEVSRGLVARIDGDAECAVLCCPGSMQYLDASLPYCGVMAVVTSHVARKQGLAGRLTARNMAERVAEGAMVAGLGIFEQGYYDRLGFGTDPYENLVALDPQQLKIPGATRSPKRLTVDDWELMHAARSGRMKRHGAVTFDSPLVTQTDANEEKGGFGLGFYDGDTLTHHLWIRPESMEYGPVNVGWMAYSTNEQFLELMGLVKSIGDQVRLVRIYEPADIQLQDLIRQPIQGWMITQKSKFATGIETLAASQTRICDLIGCLENTSLKCDDLKFNLELTDPIEDLLDDSAPWRGLTGDYVVTLGTSSGAEEGSDASLPTLKASAGAFTRLWLGVRPATGLAITDSIEGPPELLEALDWALRLPTPKRDWEF